MRGGALNDPNFHSRQRGAGPFAQLLRARFERARRALGLDGAETLRTDLFVRPLPPSGQLDLWGSR
jgi:hypothetical protein